MTKRRDEQRPRSFQQLMYAAAERMDEGALAALKQYREIEAAGGKPQILFSDFHGWVIKDLMAQRP
jgi:hypothetical protein